MLHARVPTYGSLRGLLLFLEYQIPIWLRVTNYSIKVKFEFEVQVAVPTYYDLTIHDIAVHVSPILLLPKRQI